MRKWAIMVLAILLVLAGCGQKQVDNSSQKEVKTKPEKNEKQVTKVEPKDPYTFPLTGKGSQTSTDGRAIAVMINNHPEARPQSGLNKADLVYELLAEGDITRFLAVFQSEKPVNIGPVRSARPYYLELAKGLNALFIAHGYSPEAKQMLDNGYIDNLNGMQYDGTLFKRASFRKAPHNSYIMYENVLKGAAQKKYSMTQTPPAFSFMTDEESKNLTGDPATSASVTYSSNAMFDCLYQYDAELGRYKRFSGGEQTVDLETKEPILLDNIFIVEAVHQVMDSGGHRNINLQSGGKAWLLQKGKVNAVEWKNVNNRIVPFKDGKEVPFVQGKTWVNIVPATPGLLKSVSFNVK
jgi:predicted small lipoprotein YifL